MLLSMVPCIDLEDRLRVALLATISGAHVEEDLGFPDFISPPYYPTASSCEAHMRKQGHRVVLEQWAKAGPSQEPA